MTAARECKKNRDTERSPMSELTDDFLIEIISRVPLKSICCCKCVSTRWRDLVSHPGLRKKVPQTLAGFFYKSNRKDRYPSVQPGYQSVSGNWYGHIDTSLSFLPRCKIPLNMFLLDCCNGLLLCRNWMSTDLRIAYVVCNPATEKWVTVPATSWSSEVWFVRLAFDPAVSSHFHVFEFAPTRLVDGNMQGSGGHTKAVRIYSSKARVWTHQIVWDNPVSISCISKGVFFSGMLYLSSSHDFVVAIDMEGNYRVIRVPTPQYAGDVHHVYLSQRQLHLANKSASGLSIWALEDSISETWTLKHNVSHLQLLGTEYSTFAAHYTVISIHPESNVIFIICGKRYRSPTKLMSYDMDSKRLGFICDIGWSCMNPYLSYVPLFSESLADGH